MLYTVWCNAPNSTTNREPTMRLILCLLQIAMLAAGFSSNRADAMVGAAVFSVLCVVIVISSARQARGVSTRQLKTNRSHP